MITINTILDMRPGAVPKIIHLSQYDSDFSLVFRLHASFGTLNIESGTTAEIRGTKKSGTGYSASATLNTSNNTVTVTGDAQMTAVAGQNTYEIVLTKNNKVLGSANFILLVERAALDADTITDATVLRDLEAIVEGAETATQAAEDAEDAADRAEAAAESLEIDSAPTQGSAHAVSSGGVYDALNNREIYSEDVVAEYDVVTEPPKTYSEITQVITPVYTNQGKWNAETDSADSGTNCVYSRFNGVAQYKKIYVNGKGASSDYTYPLCAFYDSNGDKISAILANWAWGTINMLISVPLSASYVIVNGSTESNRPISPSVRGLIDGEKIGTLIELTGVSAEGAKKTDGTIASGASYYHVRYDDVPDSDYIYVSGTSWGTSYPLILFYDSSDTLIHNDLGYGSTKFNDVEISIPDGTAYYIVNMTHTDTAGSAQKVDYATSQSGRIPTKTQEEFNTELKTFIHKKYLFVGDSYAQGYSHDGMNPGWCSYVAEYMGLETGEYKTVATGGYGFANGGYSSLLDGVTDTGFTDIVVCGGYNDNTSTAQNIINGITAFKNKIMGKWATAKVHVGFIAYNKAGNGEGAITNWEEKRASLISIVLPSYQKSITVGCEYLNNVEYALGESGLSPSDGYHPNAEGNQAIAKAVANALITGSAPLPNERYEITDDIKKALLQCFEKIAWKDNTGRTSFLELANALHVKISDRREELPDTYEQVEFIKSTRAQYIALTDVLTQIPIDIRVKASLETADDRTGGYLVSALGSGTQRFYAVTYTNSKMAARIGNNGWTEVTVTDEVVIGQPYQIETSISYASGGDANLVVKYNLGQQSAVLTAQSISGVDGHTLALFASDASGGTRGVWALYEIVIYSGQTKIFDGIPCYRKSDNKTGLFDAVSNSFYPNATTTEFVVGNVVE